MRHLVLCAAVLGVSANVAGADPVIDRPLALERHAFDAHLDVGIAHHAISAGGITATSNTERTDLGGAFGVTADVTVGLDYGLALHPWQRRGPLTAFAAWSIVHTATLDLGVSADLVIDLGSTDATGAASATEALHAGVGVRYKVAPAVAIVLGGARFGAAPFPFSAPFGPLAGRPLGQQLGLAFHSGAPSSFDVPVGVALQATSRIYVGAATNLAHLAIANDDTAVLAADVLPFAIGAMFSATRTLEVGAFLDLPDLERPTFDRTFLGIGARYTN